MSNLNERQSNLMELRRMFGKDETFVFRNFTCSKAATEFCVVYVSGMVDKASIHMQIIKPIMDADFRDDLDINQLLGKLSNEIISSAHVNESSELEKLLQALLSGSTILFAKEFDKAIIIDTADWDKRSIEEPPSEKAVTGPREGFTENIGTNIVLVRRKLKTPNLKFRFLELGTETNTKICICFVDQIADSKIVEEVERRLSKIKIDGVLDVGYIQELIRDTPLTPFKSVGTTERPDVVAGKLLEGRIAIICDGTPIVLTIPFLFIEYFNVNEDYYNNFYFASINRLIRWIGFFLASSVPAIYVALVTFHQEMLPTPLLLSISGSRQNVPLPTIAEALLMLFVFELLRETSVRIPSVAGQTISIVGALVIGQAAVQAKLVSAPIVIVAALTGIASFVTPKMQGGLILIRVIFLLFSSFIGLYGYILCVIGMFIHLASLRSFSIPYMLGIGVLSSSDTKDMMIRAPWQKMKNRPHLVAQENKNRADIQGGNEDE